jgi:hypothetical protein
MTLCIEITDPEKAEWIWKSHLEGGNPELGVKVWAVAEGNMFKEHEQLEQAAGFYLREEGEETHEAVGAHEEPFHSVSDAVNDANFNVTPGAKWDVIDVWGNVHASGVSAPKKESCVQ